MSNRSEILRGTGLLQSDTPGIAEVDPEVFWPRILSIPYLFDGGHLNIIAKVAKQLLHIRSTDISPCMNPFVGLHDQVFKPFQDLLGVNLVGICLSSHDDVTIYNPKIEVTKHFH